MFINLLFQQLQQYYSVLKDQPLNFSIGHMAVPISHKLNY